MSCLGRKTGHVSVGKNKTEVGPCYSRGIGEVRASAEGVYWSTAVLVGGGHVQNGGSVFRDLGSQQGC